MSTSVTTGGLVASALQSCINVGSEVGVYWLNQCYHKIIQLQAKSYYTTLCASATNYEQWAAAARQLDTLDGLLRWREDPASPHYEFQLVQDRLAQLIKARESSDLSSMLFLLRTSLCRNLGDMGNHKVNLSFYSDPFLSSPSLF